MVKKEGRNEQTRLGATTDSMLSELVVSLQGETQPGEEFHLNVLVQLVKLLLLRSQNVREMKERLLKPEFHVGSVSLLRVTEPCEAFL